MMNMFPSMVRRVLSPLLVAARDLAPVVIMARHITDQLADPREFATISPDFHLVDRKSVV